MHTISSRSRRTLLAGCALAVALALPSVAGARPVKADLRVETGSAALSADTYMTDGVRVRTESRPGCNGSGDVKEVAGPTALGLLVDASRARRRLRPLAVSDEFSFGLLVCGVGDAVATGATSFWLYKVGHVSPEVGGDGYRLRSGDDVLWYFVDSARNLNTGDELELVAPARARAREPFEVTVYAYDSAGARRPAEGAVVAGGATPQTTDANGVARVTLDRNATVRLRAARGADIASAPTAVCAHRRVARCPAVRGERIFGSARGERIRGTRGADRIAAGRGSDRVLVRGGRRDRVRCGRGRDVVLADRRDRVARDCEVVRRRG